MLVTQFSISTIRCYSPISKNDIISYKILVVDIVLLDSTLYPLSCHLRDEIDFPRARHK